jgi:tetratricopeptide (TPR) repeat protein
MPFEPLLIGECFIQENHGTLKGLRAQMLIEILCRYINLNERDDALQILNAYLKEENNTMPLLLHYKAFLENKTPPENTDGKWDFISRIESANVLRYAIDKNPEDYSSLYHLGNFYAHKRRWEDALACWRKVKGNCKSLALRGEGVYWWKIKGDMEQASESYRQAAEHEDCGAKTLWEYDHLLDEKNDNETRVRLFEEHADLASSDKRLLLRKADALVSLGKAEEAMEILLKNSFPLCEGKILPRLLFEDACWQIAERHRENNDFDKALENMMKPMAYPENLGVGKPASNMEAEWFWRCGKLCQEKGNQEKANEFFKRGADPGNGIPIDFFPLKNLVWQHDSEMIELPVWINILFRADCLKELQMQDESEKTFSYARSFIEDKLKEERENEPELKVLKHLLDVLSGEKTESSWTPQKIPYTRFLQYET